MDTCILCLEKYDILIAIKCHSECGTFCCPTCKRCSFGCSTKGELKKVLARYQKRIEEYDAKVLVIRKRVEIMSKTEGYQRSRQKRLKERDNLRRRWDDGIFPEFNTDSGENNWKFVCYV